MLEDQISFTAPPVVVGNVPEPASLAPLGIGLLGLLGLLATRRRHQATPNLA